MLIRSITRREFLVAAAATLAVAGPSTPTTRPRLPTPRGPLTGLATTTRFELAAEVARLRGELARFDQVHLPRLLDGLANNRFEVISRFLDLPEIHGPWKGFVPRFLFAVLLGKAALRDLARPDRRVGEPPRASWARGLGGGSRVR